MGSLEEEEEEEKLLQMVHDFIESSDPKTSPSSTNQKHAHFLHSKRFFTLQEMLKKKTGEEEKIHEKVWKLMENKMDLEKTSRVKKWLVKCLNKQLNGIRASLCHTSWVTTPSCPCGNYEYIEVVKEDNAKGGSQRLIVDIDFKSQFEVARPTQSYSELLSKLPIIFVGNEDKLNRIISLICSAAEESLKEKGLHIPPWRRATYMQSKWKLINDNTSNNTCVNSNSNSNSNEVNYSRGLEKWVPQNGMKRGFGGEGSGLLSNQLSNKSINCC